MPVGWVAAGAAVLGAGASIYSSNQAANAQEGAANRASNTQQGMFNYSAALQRPFVVQGQAASSALSQLLGLGNPQDSAQNAQVNDLFTGVNGVPTMNPSLYNSDPAYKYAWDTVLARHQQQFGTGYTSRSDPSSLATQLEQAMSQYHQQNPTSSGGNTNSGWTMSPDGTMHQMLTAGGPSAPSGTPGGVSGTGLPAGYLTQLFGPQQFLQNVDPGYGFRLQQGNTALTNSAAASTGSMSGAAIKSLLGYNQDYASGEYNNAFNRFETQQGNIFQRLSDIANRGQNAAAGVGQQAVNTGANIGANIVGAGNARAGADVATGNAIGQLGSNLATYSYLNQIMKQPTSTVAATGNT